MVCIYALTVLHRCTDNECSQKIIEIERNVEALINEYLSKKDAASLYGNLVSFDFVSCYYDVQTVENGLKKIAEVKGEAYNIRKEELISSVRNTVDSTMQRMETERRQIIEKAEKITKQQEANGADPKEIQKMREKIAQAKAFSASTATIDASVDDTNNIRDIYLKADKVSAQIGSTGIAFVFSCPGQKEQIANQVCYGATGENLQHLITICHEKRPDIFVSELKCDYTITNASDRVHYAALTHDTEASYDEIRLPENIQRLSYELSNANVIICMGDRADFAVHNAVVSGKIVKGEHLSAMHINRSYTSTADSPSTRRFDRISQVANKILEQL